MRATDQRTEDTPRDTCSPAPMMSPPTMAPGIEVKPPRISTGSAFSAISASVELHAQLDLPQVMPATSATTPATVQTMIQMRLQAGCRRRARPGDRPPPRAARGRCDVLWKKIASTATSAAGDQGANHQLEDLAAAPVPLDEGQRDVEQRSPDPWAGRCPARSTSLPQSSLPAAFQHVEDADGGHEQG